MTTVETKEETKEEKKEEATLSKVCLFLLNKQKQLEIELDELKNIAQKIRDINDQIKKNKSVISDIFYKNPSLLISLNNNETKLSNLESKKLKFINRLKERAELRGETKTEYRDDNTIECDKEIDTLKQEIKKITDEIETSKQMKLEAEKNNKILEPKLIEFKSMEEYEKIYGQKLELLAKVKDEIEWEKNIKPLYLNYANRYKIKFDEENDYDLVGKVHNNYLEEPISISPYNLEGHPFFLTKSGKKNFGCIGWNSNNLFCDCGRTKYKLLKINREYLENYKNFTITKYGGICAKTHLHIYERVK